MNKIKRELRFSSSFLFSLQQKTKSFFLFKNRKTNSLTAAASFRGVQRCRVTDTASTAFIPGGMKCFRGDEVKADFVVCVCFMVRTDFDERKSGTTF